MRLACNPMRKQVQGFTLVEVLVTILLIAIVLPTAMKGVTLGTRLAAHARRQIEATVLGKSRLAELIASRAWENGTQTRGDFGRDNPDYEWSLEMVNWEVSPMTLMSITVYWNPDQLLEENSVTVSTLVYPKE